VASVLDNVRIVMVHTSHPGNIGAVARAMKNMRLKNLDLVAPRQFPHAEATARASGADDLLACARVHADLDEALADCRLVVGASARSRSVEWPVLDPRQCAAEVIGAAAEGPVAVLFGRESSGLTNEELDRCRYLVQIPANPEYASLNVAMAVQLIAYELMMAAIDPTGLPEARVLAAAGRFEGFMEHLADTLGVVDFADARQSPKLLRRLRRLFLRAELDDEEINILRGVLTAVQQGRSGRGKS